MNLASQFANHPYLKSVLTSYFLLSIMDTIHHLHAALALGHGAAMHSVAINAALVPVAVTMLWLFLRQNRKAFLWAFLAIATLAVLVPGIYHGGWVHVVKTIHYAVLNGQSTDIDLLFAANDLNHWFYELSGIAEFLLALSCAYFIYKCLTDSSNLAAPGHKRRLRS